MDIAIKAVLGACVAVLLHFAVASKRYSYLAGLIPLFPTFALFAHVMFASERKIVELQGAAAFGLVSLLPYGMYLILIWKLSPHMSLWLTLAFAVLAWILVASGALFIWKGMIRS